MFLRSMFPMFCTYTHEQFIQIVSLKKQYTNLTILVDECHSAGVLGINGKGAASRCGVEVDIINGTLGWYGPVSLTLTEFWSDFIHCSWWLLGKALGGASGGYTCASQEIIDVLRQKSRPYVFSNSLPPSIVAASIQVLDILESTEESSHLFNKLNDNTSFFRQEIEKEGFLCLGEH